MKGKSSFYGVFFLISILMINLFMILPVYAQDSQITFIANESVPLSSITIKDLQKIFLGKKTSWEDGSKIRFVLFDDEAAHTAFLEKIGKTESKFRNYWKKKVFTGKAKEPLQFNTLEELVDYVANTEGAIAYVISPVSNDKVKTISITE